MDLSVITVTLNSAEYIGEQINSVVSACAGIEYEQIIVDNNSTDNTTTIIQNQFPSIQLLKNKANKGFAAANNRAVPFARGCYLLFLNPDMVIKAGQSEQMRTLINWLDKNPTVGIVTCKLIDENGAPNINEGPRRFPTLLNQLVIILKLQHLFPRLLRNYYYYDIDLNKQQEVDTVRGSFMIVRQELVIKLGRAFDEQFFVWFEEVDLCRSAHARGYKVVYYPALLCVDLVGRAFRQLDNMWRQKQFTKSMLIYFKKWEPTYKWLPLTIFRPIGILLVWLKNKFI